MFAEFFLFLKDYKPPHPWQIVVIYFSRQVEREQSLHFKNLLNLPEVRRIYLDELGKATDRSLGVGIINLVVESEEQAVPLARNLIDQTRNQLSDQTIQKNLIDLIETIIVYKFPLKTREEIEAMFNLSDLKQTRVYQEAFAEGEANLILRLLNRRIGALSSSLVEEVRSLSVEQLENLGEAIFDFTTESDLRQWLEANS